MSTDSTKPRARDLGVPFDGTPGRRNAITDVAGVEVGHETIIAGDPRGAFAVRTGVTAVLPRGKCYDPVFAGFYSLNGNGEMTGTIWLSESGFLESPVLITNTHSVGVVRDAAVRWMIDSGLHSAGATGRYWLMPVVAETYDGILNDVDSQHVTAGHAAAALDAAAGGAVAEGNVGGGTGMVCYRFKGGIGTASRVLEAEAGGFTVGVLLQANFGERPLLTIAGVPVGRRITDLQPVGLAAPGSEAGGSVIVVVATDAPLLPHQLNRLARRVPMGLARTGSIAANTSGDIFLAFAAANAGAAERFAAQTVEMLPNDRMTPLFEAVVQATEEAVVNALVAAETMEGHQGSKIHAIPHDRLSDLMTSAGQGGG